MKFFDYADDTAVLLKRAKKAGRNVTRDDVYRMILNAPQSGTYAVRHALWEAQWVADGRPYYDLYPALIESFAALNLNIPPTTIQPPCGMKNLLVSFPDCDANKTARIMWIAWQPTRWPSTIKAAQSGDGLGEPYIVVGGDFGERDSEGYQVANVYAPPPDDSKTIQEWLEALAYQNDVVEPTVPGIYPNDQEALFKLVRIAVCLCLLGNHPDYVIPQVLNRDADKAAVATPEELAALIERARSNGKYGFSIGAKIESIPHTRRPHPALYRVGVGRKESKIIFRKGAIVNRKKATTMPTGYQGETSNAQ